jgi:hypothetical protein
MKNHLYRTILFLCGTLLLSSCLKDDPKNNPTIYYAYQQIPNINEFMPQRLLFAFGNENLHFGDEPPKIEGLFVANDVWITDVDTVPSSAWMLPSSTIIPNPQYFEFYDQHKGIAKMKFKSPKGIPGQVDYFLEQSSTDMTDSIIRGNTNRFVEDTISPIYFKMDKLESRDFNTVYVMGEDPYFTVFYYEIRDIKTKCQPLNAVILTGKMDEEIQVVSDTINHTIDTIVKPVIKDLKWGIQTMMYYNETASITQLIRLGFLPTPGDHIMLRNASDTHIGELP